MIKIGYLKEAGTKGYIGVGILQDGEKKYLTVDEETYAAVGAPVRGDTLTGEEYRTLSEASERYRVVLSALHILGYGDNSVATLVKKLTAKGFSRESAALAAEEMVRLGYIDETRALTRLILLEANKRNGPKKILAACVRRGYSVARAKAVLTAQVTAGEIDFAKNLEALYQKKAGDTPLTPEERAKIKYRYGY